MRAVDLHNRIKKYGLSVRGGNIYRNNYKVGEFTTHKGREYTMHEGSIKEINSFDKNTEELISSAAL